MKPPVELGLLVGLSFFALHFCASHVLWTSMPSNSDKWIRSIKDNPAGKVVADPEGNRWEWQSEDETSHLLKKLSNDELSIESTDLHPKIERPDQRTTAPTASQPPRRSVKPGSRDSGGGFNPYDNAGKKRR